MLGRLGSLLCTATMTTALFLGTSATILAHGGGGHGGGGAGGHGSYGGHPGGPYHGGYHQGGPYHGGYYHNYYGGFNHGYGYPGYGYGFYRPYYGYGGLGVGGLSLGGLGLGGLGLGGLGLGGLGGGGLGLGGLGAGGLGMGGYGLGGYGGGGYGLYPPYGGGPVAVPAFGGYAAAPGGAIPGQTPPPDNAAHLQLAVPENAEIRIDGEMTRQTGAVREFVSPPLTPGQSFTYQISVRYTNAAGKAIEDTRPIHVRANDWFRIDFTRPAPPENAPAPLPRP